MSSCPIKKLGSLELGLHGVRLNTPQTNHPRSVDSAVPAAHHPFMISPPPSQLLCAACSEPSPATDPACAACGQSPLLDGRYRLEVLLGQGAMGVTFRATRLSDGLVVAAKELPLHRVDSLKMTELFEREAHILRALSHPSIPAWVDHFTLGSGKQMALWIVQEFIDGDTLAALAATRYPDERAVLLTLRDLLDTLVYLGDLRPPVIHRDLKPQNIMRRRADNSFVLIDFGSVRAAISDSAAGGSTVAGTFGYMAPEQFAGLATTATDIYGAGATALALLAGTGAEQLLGTEGRLDWRERVVMSRGLRALLEGMLSSNPEHRPTAQEARAEVEALLAGPAAPPEPVAIRRPAPQVRSLPSAPTPRLPTETRSNWGVIIGAVLIAALSVVALVVVAGGDSEMPALATRAPVVKLAPFVAPPLGLEFGMSHEAAMEVWPALVNAAPITLELAGNEPGIGGPRTGSSENTHISTIIKNKNNALRGVAYEAQATLDQLDATCKIRFASIDHSSAPTLIMFRCDLLLGDDGARDAAAGKFLADWSRRFGPPTGRARGTYGSGVASPEPMQPDPGVVGRWESPDATVQIVKDSLGLSLQGALHKL